MSDPKNFSEACARLAQRLAEAEKDRDQARGWANRWHHVLDTICVILGIEALDADEVAGAVRSKFEAAEIEVTALRQKLEEAERDVKFFRDQFDDQVQSWEELDARARRLEEALREARNRLTIYAQQGIATWEDQTYAMIDAALSDSPAPSEDAS